MYAYRLERAVLHRDDKGLTAWNGLALDEPKYLEAARRTADFLEDRLIAALKALWGDVSQGGT